MRQNQACYTSRIAGSAFCTIVSQHVQAQFAKLADYFERRGSISSISEIIRRDAHFPPHAGQVFASASKAHSAAGAWPWPPYRSATGSHSQLLRKPQLSSASSAAALQASSSCSIADSASRRRTAATQLPINSFQLSIHCAETDQFMLETSVLSVRWIHASDRKCCAHSSHARSMP